MTRWNEYIQEGEGTKVINTSRVERLYKLQNSIHHKYVSKMSRYSKTPGKIIRLTIDEQWVVDVTGHQNILIQRDLAGL